VRLFPALLPIARVFNALPKIPPFLFLLILPPILPGFFTEKHLKLCIFLEIYLPSMLTVDFLCPHSSGPGLIGLLLFHGRLFFPLPYEGSPCRRLADSPPRYFSSAYKSLSIGSRLLWRKRMHSVKPALRQECVSTPPRTDCICTGTFFFQRRRHARIQPYCLFLFRPFLDS